MEIFKFYFFLNLYIMLTTVYKTVHFLGVLCIQKSNNIIYRRNIKINNFSTMDNIQSQLANSSS